MANTKETDKPGAPAQSGTGQTGSQLEGSQQAGGQPGQQIQQGQQNDRGGPVQERRKGGAVSAYTRDPFELMQRLSEEMDELFESFFHGRRLARSRVQSQLQSLWAPEVEVFEEGNQLRVCVDLPGVPRENVKVDVRDGVLTIAGERREERTEGGAQQGFRRSERRYGSFYRSVPLPEGAEAAKAEARMKEGVLEITVPVAQKQTRRLEIQG
jgi:HSP20 family protein